MERDVVCGMQVDPAKASAVSHFGGKTYFCSKGCKVKFDADPARFTEHRDGATVTSPAPASAIRVRRCSGPVRCIRKSCGTDLVHARSGGMALEPRTATLDEGPNVDELRPACRLHRLVARGAARGQSRAIVRAASAASKAADYILGFQSVTQQRAETSHAADDQEAA